MRRRNWESRGCGLCWFSSWLWVLFFCLGCARVCISDSGGVVVVGWSCKMPLMSPSRLFHPCCRVLVHLFCLVPACLKGKLWCFGPVSSAVHLNVFFEGVFVAVERAFDCPSPPCLTFSQQFCGAVHLNVSRFCGNANRSKWQISVFLRYFLPISNALSNICYHRCSALLSFHLRLDAWCSELRI